MFTPTLPAASNNECGSFRCSEAPEELTTPSELNAIGCSEPLAPLGIERVTTDARLDGSAYGFWQLAGGRSVVPRRPAWPA